MLNKMLFVFFGIVSISVAAEKTVMTCGLDNGKVSPGFSAPIEKDQGFDGYTAFKEITLDGILYKFTYGKDFTPVEAGKSEKAYHSSYHLYAFDLKAKKQIAHFNANCIGECRGFDFSADLDWIGVNATCFLE